MIEFHNGKPCTNKTCYAHKTKPCEICGRINMKGSGVILSITKRITKKKKVKKIKTNPFQLIIDL